MEHFYKLVATISSSTKKKEKKHSHTHTRERERERNIKQQQQYIYKYIYIKKRDCLSSTAQFIISIVSVNCAYLKMCSISLLVIK